jgi:hypothetical protein
LKAAGQKAALAEVNIRNIQVKARKMKAGVREKFKYLPPNQFNMDLCLDSIQVMNCIPNLNQVKILYKLFTVKQVNYMRDFRAEWGELIIAKKPKGLASDLTVTGKWVAVVRRIMNGSGILKVYLINSREYAYRLQFQLAVTPTWVLDALEQVLNRNISIGFEENETMPDRHDLIMDELNVGTDIDKEMDKLMNESPNNPNDWGDETPIVLMRVIDMIEEVLNMTNNDNNNNKTFQPETTETVPATNILYTTNSGQVVKTPQWYGFVEAFAVIKEYYKEK